jgi:hypothetical protein
LSIGQLPLVVVCDVVVPELAFDGVAAVFDDVLALEDVESSDSEFEELVPDVVAAAVDLVLAAAAWVVLALWPSCQARTPPSESIAATLSAAAALRALAARGLRRPGGRAGTRVGTRVGVVAEVGVCSFMATTVRISHEGVARAG